MENNLKVGFYLSSLTCFPTLWPTTGLNFFSFLCLPFSLTTSHSKPNLKSISSFSFKKITGQQLNMHNRQRGKNKEQQRRKENQRTGAQHSQQTKRQKQGTTEKKEAKTNNKQILPREPRTSSAEAHPCVEVGAPRSSPIDWLTRQELERSYAREKLFSYCVCCLLIPRPAREAASLVAETVPTPTPSPPLPAPSSSSPASLLASSPLHKAQPPASPSLSTRGN